MNCATRCTGKTQFVPPPDKDVMRTDRTHKFFSGDKNPNLQVLYDILMTYCMYNFDLGKSHQNLFFILEAQQYN